LCVILENELSEFNRIISILETHSSVESNAKSPLTLKRILVWTLEPQFKFELLKQVVDTFECGSHLIDSIHSNTLNGDPRIALFMNETLEHVMKPLMSMVCMWTTCGTLNDPFDEFFVVKDRKLSLDNSMSWNAMYSMNKIRCPSLISTDTAEKILLIGKTLNFIKYSCEDSEFVGTFKSQFLESDFQHPSTHSFHEVVEKAYTLANEHLLRVLFTTFKYKHVLYALKQYLLLGAGDFATSLLSELE